MLFRYRLPKSRHSTKKSATRSCELPMNNRPPSAPRIIWSANWEARKLCAGSMVALSATAVRNHRVRHTDIGVIQLANLRCLGAPRQTLEKPMISMAMMVQLSKNHKSSILMDGGLG